MPSGPVEDLLQQVANCCIAWSGGVGKGSVALPVKLVMEVTLGCSELVLAFDFSCLEARNKLPLIGV